ncbi:alpha/beta fold hydrolase [Ovoidimarina sediminis]|uniref:alpha/beta fold hydrolase n=1 Tax=Ovoidimarina sediminis TaxID=3079856 RepID=UPI00291294F0|nr:alpha/beta fold hydrolase [Rhodophyticola sp. MJ-SS7]MDU8946584.1 alpha/beta fold hydrolase [Rhodophyticola sp. MJ-SS7]
MNLGHPAAECSSDMRQGMLATAMMRLLAIGYPTMLISGLIVSASVAQTLDSVESVLCPNVVAQTVTEVEGETFACGVVRVPADYDDPEGRQIELMYGVLRSTSLSPATDPVIYLHGGPGGGELASMTNVLAERLATLRTRRDIFIFDQRGSGFSPGEIECNEVFAANGDAAFEAADEIADASGMNLGAAASEYLIPLCAAHLNGQGVDLSQYNTVNNARDVVRLAEALGFDRYNIYGHSYGTRLGLEVLRQGPPGLRAILLDSVLPTDVAWRERLPETNEEAFLGIYGMCLEDPSCANAYPDLVKTLNGVFSALSSQPLTTESGFLVTGRALEQLILSSANQAGTEWRVRYLPRMIHNLAEGNTELYEALYIMLYAEAETAAPPTYRLEASSIAARLLLNRANTLASQSDALQQSAEALALQAMDLASEAEETPAAVFLQTVRQLEDVPYSTTLDANYVSDRVALPLRPATSGELGRFVKRHFSGVDAEILMALVEPMTPDDIADVYRRLRNEDRYTRQLQELAFALRLFTCNDSVPFNSSGRALARMADYRIPGLTQREARIMAYELGACGGLPTGSVREDFHAPVTGDGSVPVMVFTGTNDIQTASSWAQHAKNSLVGSQFVRFPNTGHGATLFSQCAKDVAAAFFDQPNEPTNTDCKKDLIPTFVLPEDPIP